MTLTTRPARCWAVAHPDGALVDADNGWVPHFDTAAAAYADAWERTADNYGEAYPGYPEPERYHVVHLAKPCVIVSCAGCREPMENWEWGGTAHCEDASDARAAFDYLQWFGAVAWCDDCEPDPAVTAALQDADRTPGPGQLALDGGEVS